MLLQQPLVLTEQCVASLSAFPLDLFGFEWYSFSHWRRLERPIFLDPLEGTEISKFRDERHTVCLHNHPKRGPHLRQYAINVAHLCSSYPISLLSSDHFHFLIAYSEEGNEELQCLHCCIHERG
jgi:hypothetical protein